jgi:hypothetical protein
VVSGPRAGGPSDELIRADSCGRCDDPVVVEYGNGVGQVAGQASGGGGTSVDVSTAVGRFVTDSVHTLSTTPPGMLALGVVVVVLGLLFLRRAL